MEKHGFNLLLTSTIYDKADIVSRTCDFFKKANLLFYSFKYCTPTVLTFPLHSAY